MALPKGLKYGAIAAAVGLFGVLFGWVLFPAILKSMLKKEMALSKKTDVRKMWETIPFPLDFKVYIFNYTNPDEIQKGAIPIVKEIGPFYFAEFKEKLEIEDHEEDDTVTYKRRDTFYFKPELSGSGLTGEELVTIPHMVIVGLVVSVSREKPAMMNVVGKAINGIFDNPSDIFLRVKVLDLLFRGLIINCARTEFAPKAVCTQLKKEGVRGLSVEDNGQMRFSLFGMRNHSTNPHVVTVKRGIKNIMEVGRVIAIDGEKEVKMWRDSCDVYQGTDGTVFPPFLTERDRIETYLFELCRPFKPWYQRKSFYQGIKTNRHIVNIGDFANDPELQCFCDAPDKCPQKGVMDLSKCVGAPIYATLPHFLDTDPELLEHVKGLNPDVNQHEIMVDFEPISGTPLVVKQRVQFNMPLIQTAKIPIFKELPISLVPILWIEEGYDMNKTFVNMLKHQLFIPKRIVAVIRWWLVTFGSLGFLVSMIFHFRDDIMRIATSGDSKVTKVNPDENEQQQKDISVIGQSQEPAKISM